ncbi:PXMP2/4 family protein 4 isoform X1 [Venturia canescens]|uniref:PXMP2/4 family protein 4 isoform X1 n=1 Tax=Venturia canescens TaxID=32260 RepID=UPI001C9C5B4F|nr:PXMP2/4 family protein 4 isoform X1 [Venturia canescens]XP_043271251.1 PXMP2/4 family protein 4 isoform X1 [Venturia canescens]
MAFSTKFVSLTKMIRRRPLLFNSLVYGSFYTGAEFAQQSYNLKYQSVIQEQRDPKPSRFVSLGATTTPDEDIQRSNDIGPSQISLNYDWKQLQRYALIGCFVTGPILHGWYKWLDRIFRGTTMKIIMVKLFADQFILTPPLLVLFFISMSCLEGRKDITRECRMKFVKTFQTSCLYWIPVQFVNFLLIPPALRVLYVSVAAFCWVNILCYLKRLPLPTDKVQD